MPFTSAIWWRVSCRVSTDRRKDVAETWMHSIHPAKQLHTLMCDLLPIVAEWIGGGAGELYAGGVVMLQGEPWLTVP